MKLPLTIGFFLLALMGNLQATPLEAHITYATYKGIATPNYIELYFYINCNQLTKVHAADNRYTVSALATIHFFRNDSLSLTHRSVLSSPSAPISDFKDKGLIDLLRLPLPNGDYRMEILLNDEDTTTQNTLKLSWDVRMNYDDQSAGLGDIALLQEFSPSQSAEARFVKHAYFMQPLTFPVVPSFIHSLGFYTEVYRTDLLASKNTRLKAYLATHAQPQKPLLGYLLSVAVQTDSVQPIINQFRIDQLPAGKYVLVVQLLDMNGRTVATKTHTFRRTHPFLNVTTIRNEKIELDNSFVKQLTDDEVKYYLEGLIPQLSSSEQRELQEVLGTKNPMFNRQFLFCYWLRQNELNPEAPFEVYKKLLATLEEDFGSGFRPGYLTDRGYIYLKYGAPDDIVERNSEPVCPPYHIWTYNTLDNAQHYVKFLFYNPSLAPNDFVLLHSTARGEIHNNQWKRVLYKNAFEDRSGRDLLEGTEVNDYFGSSAADLFNE